MATSEIGGRYRLEKEIGRGGMGAVWKAFDERLKRHVALKRMSADQIEKPAARQRFEHEAFAIARLQSPHVVQIFDYGVDDDTPFLVMELLEGEDLNARIQRLKKLPIPLVQKIVQEVGKALDAAHATGIVHRDLKPDNVFLALGENGEETVKVLDFGLAALAASLGAPSSSRTILGTPLYMSPEQVRGAALIDHRSDLWALGVLTYGLITGKTPFSGDVLGELLVSICVDSADPPSSLNLGLPKGLDAFVERALAKEPRLRFQSGRELAAAFIDTFAPEARTTKLLFVDDEPDITALLKQRFRHKVRASVHELLFAADGQSALAVLREHPDIDLMLTDIRMPQMDGLTLLAEARALRPRMPVVVISAFGDMGNLRTAMNRGAFDFLVKPIDFADLDATIEKALLHRTELRVAARSTEQNNTLRMFVGHRVAERVASGDGTAFTFEDEVVEATLLFVRVCGFDGPVEHSLPTQTMRRLNASLEVLIPEIIARGGTIESLVGSTVTALFCGVSHELQAITAAVSLRDRLADLAASARTDGSAYAHGVSSAAASGKVLRGCIGSRASARLANGFLGTAVAMGTQLIERAARGDILITEITRACIEDAFELRARNVALPGEVAPLVLWNVVRPLLARKTSTVPTLPAESDESQSPFGHTANVEEPDATANILRLSASGERDDP